VSGVVGTSLTVAVAFFGSVAFLNSLTQKSVDSLKADVDKKFENIDKKFENIDKKFENMDKKFENMDKKLDSTGRTLTLVSVTSLLTLGVVVYMAVAAAVTPTR
jgi:peptidoglycan hydrolase CwlO-like protein